MTPSIHATADRRRLAAARAAAAAAALALAAPAAADSLGVLAVAPPPGPGEELAELTSQLRQVMRQKSPSLVLDTRQLHDRMAGPAPGASLAEIDRAFEGARSAAVAGDFEGSVRALRAILDELERRPEGEETFQRWTTAMLRLAKLEGDLGRADTARGVLERLLRAAPALKLDPRLYPPRFAAQVEEARSDLKALPHRKLRVTSPAPGARVFVNGREVGVAPLTEVLPAGWYRVAAVAGKGAAVRQQVDLRADDQAIELDFSLTEALRPKRGPGLALARADRTALVAVGAYLGLDAVLATGVVEEDGTSFATAALYDVRRGMLKREGRVRLVRGALPPGGPGALAEFILTGEVTSPMVELPGTTSPGPTPVGPVVTKPGEGRGTPGTRAMGWTAVGAGVATVGLGAVAAWKGFAAKGAYADARGMLTPSGTLPAGTSPAAYDAKLREGDSARRTAIVTGVGAGACAVTAGILGYLSYRQSGEIGPFRF